MWVTLGGERAFVAASLPGLTRQSILFAKLLAK